MTPEDLAQDIAESLDHLNTDHIDLYFVYVDNPGVPVEPILDTLIGALSDVRTQIGALAAQGLTFEEARAKWDFTKLKTTFCGDDPWKRFLLNAFYLGALTQNAWKEAKGIPIVQGKDVVLLESVYDA